MKINQLSWLTQKEGETMATFGEARLMKRHDGKLELIGGSPENRTEAKEWIALFLHDAVISVVSDKKPRSSPIREDNVAF